MTPVSGNTATVPVDLLEYLEHGSWRCAHPPHFYLANSGDPYPADTCPCGLVDGLHAAGLHDLADAYDPRKGTTV